MKTAMLPVYDYQEERQLLFWRLMEQHEDTIYRVLRKYKFIPADEYNDYRQEILIEAWNTFHKYMQGRDRFSFGQWLFMTGRAVAFTHRCRQLKTSSRNTSRLYRNRYVYMDRMDEVFEIEDSIYDESHIAALNKMLHSLTPDELRVVTLYLSDTDMQALSISEGRKIHYYSQRFRSVKKKLQDLAGDILPERRVVIKPQPQKSRGHNEQNILSKPILQIDTQGAVVKKWPSINEAERTGGFRAKTIQQVAAGQKGSHGGYLWLYHDTTPERVRERVERMLKSGGQKTEAKPVDQLALDGSFIKRFPSLSATKESGFEPTNISAVIRGKVQTHAGYRWRYSECSKTETN
jgi:RNA polymerase sigma factor (sigma-70 family)